MGVGWISCGATRVDLGTVLVCENYSTLVAGKARLQIDLRVGPGSVQDQNLPCDLKQKPFP